MHYVSRLRLVDGVEELKAQIVYIVSVQGIYISSDLSEMRYSLLRQ